MSHFFMAFPALEGFLRSAVLRSIYEMAWLC
jgi:hypothetical protein